MSKSRKVSFFGSDSITRTGLVAMDMVTFGSDDEQRTEFVFNKIDRSIPLSNSVPRDATGVLGLNPRGHFAGSNLVVFDSNEDGSYQLSVLPGSKISEMFSEDGHNSVSKSAALNNQINEWIVSVRLVAVRESRHPKPMVPKPEVDMVIDLNERGVVVHQSLLPVLLESMFSNYGEYYIKNSLLYTRCDMTGGLFGIGIGGRLIEWPAAGLWFSQPAQQIVRNGQNFCKTHVSFTSSRQMMGRMRIGKMLMQQLTMLVLSASEKRVFMEFVTPGISAVGRSVIRLNPVQDPVSFVRTFDWPTVHEQDSLVYLTFPTHPEGRGEWCLFTPHVRFVDGIQKVSFYSCDPKRTSRAELRHSKVDGSDINIDEFFRVRDEEFVEDSDDLVFAAPRDSEVRGSIEIIETPNTMEIILRYEGITETDSGSTGHESESDQRTVSDSDVPEDSQDRGKKRSSRSEDTDSTSSEEGLDDKRYRKSDKS